MKRELCVPVAEALAPGVTLPVYRMSSKPTHSLRFESKAGSVIWASAPPGVFRETKELPHESSGGGRRVREERMPTLEGGCQRSHAEWHRMAGRGIHCDPGRLFNAPIYVCCPLGEIERLHIS